MASDFFPRSAARLQHHITPVMLTCFRFLCRIFSILLIKFAHLESGPELHLLPHTASGGGIEMYIEARPTKSLVDYPIYLQANEIQEIVDYSSFYLGIEVQSLPASVFVRLQKLFVSLLPMSDSLPVQVSLPKSS